jgi:signal transduction histidine kinase
MNLKQIWAFLVTPHLSLTDIEQRRQSQLLAALMVAVIGSSTLASLLLLQRNGLTPTISYLWAAVLFTLVLYAVNRRGYYQASATIFVGFNFVLTYSMVILTLEPAWLFFTIMTLLLSAMLLSTGVTNFIFAAGLICHILLRQFFPITSTYSNFTTTVIYLVIGPLILTFMNNRLTIERERQAELQKLNAILQQSEVELEKRVTARTRDLQLASAVARQITTVLDLKELLPKLTLKIQQDFGLYFVGLFLYEPQSEELILTASAGDVVQWAVQRGNRITLSHPADVVAQSGREQKVQNNLNSNANQAELDLPMVVASQLIGVLVLQTAASQKFPADEVKIFTTLAEQIAIAIKNAQLYQYQLEVADELRQADQAKSQFLASMTHELRTPLNAIINFNEIMALEIIGPINEEQRSFLQQSVESSKHLLQLINDVLDISKIQAGKLALFIEKEVNLEQELQAVLTMTQPLIKDKPVQLTAVVSPQLPVIAADKRRVRQIFLNLISNAIKFTDEGEIMVKIEVQPSQILAQVSDTGVGIPAEMHQLIFEPFIQTISGLKQIEGTGLGLPITKSLVEAHGGQLWVESVVGQGSTFSFTLPLIS